MCIRMVLNLWNYAYLEGDTEVKPKYLVWPNTLTFGNSIGKIKLTLNIKILLKYFF